MNFKSQILPCLIFVFFFFLFFGIPSNSAIQADDNGYVLFAKEIINAQIVSSAQSPSWFTVVNSPVYPGLLALFISILGYKYSAVVLLHALFALLTLFILIYRLQTFAKPWLITALAFLAFYLWKDQYYLIDTHWLALCSILIFLSFIPQNYQECSALRLSGLGLVLSFIILLQPILFSFLIVTILIVAFVVRIDEKRKVSVGILLGLLPVFFWCLFNSYRFGSFTPAAFAGHRLFGIAASIGNAEFSDQEEMPDIVSFSKYVNENKYPKVGQEETFIDKLPEVYRSTPYTHNIYKVGLQYEREKVHPSYLYNSLMYSYAARVLLENPMRYARYIFEGLKSLSRDLWLMLISAIMLTMLIRSGHEFSLILGAALAAHLSNVFVTSASSIVVDTNYLLTMIPLGFITVLSILSVISRSSNSRQVYPEVYQN